MTAKELIAQGYRRTSNAFGLVSRIDRPDWKEYMASLHPNGMDWVHALEQTPGSAEDHYRRCYSKDTLELSRSVAKQIPPSGGSSVGYKAKRKEPTP